MKFLDIITKNRQQQTQTKSEQFAALLTRAATKDDLKPAEALTLGELHDELAIAPELESLAADVREYEETKTHGASDNIAKLSEVSAAARTKTYAFDAETTRIENEHQAAMTLRLESRYAAVIAPQVETTKAHDLAIAAKKRRGELEQRLWKVLGIPDPAIEVARLQAVSDAKYEIDRASYKVEPTPNSLGFAEPVKQSAGTATFQREEPKRGWPNLQH